MPRPFGPLAHIHSYTPALLFLFLFNPFTNSLAAPQWNNPSDFYSNSYQYQYGGFMPTSAFGVNTQYGVNSNNNFGAFNRPFMTKPGSFVPYGNSFGATLNTGGGGSAASTSHLDGDDNSAHATSSNTQTNSASSSLNAGPMSGMGSQVGSTVGGGDSVAANGAPSPTINAAVQQMTSGPMGSSMNVPMNGPMGSSMNGPTGTPANGQMNGQMNNGMGSQMNGAMGSQMNGAMGGQMNGAMNGMMNVPMNGMMNGMNPMGMTGMNDMMANGYGAGIGTNELMNQQMQWPGLMNKGMINSYGGSCYGPGCFPNFPGGLSMNPNGFDYPNGGPPRMGSSLGQNGGGEDYNSAEESIEMGGGDGIEQANLQRYAEYLNLINRRYGIGMPGQVSSPSQVPANTGNVITNGASPQGTGTFNGVNMMNTMDGIMPNTGYINPMNGPVAGVNNMGGIDGLTTNGVPMDTAPNGIAGGVSSLGTNPIQSNTPSGMGALIGRYSAQPSMGFNSGIVGYGSYMPNMQNVYESQTYPIQWPISSGYGSGALTNLASTTNGMGIIDGYGPTGTIPTDYMGIGSNMPSPYGYPGIQYPMNTQIYPQNVIPSVYPGATTTGQSVISPEVQASKSREKSSQESSATSREHIQSPPPATSIQALTQQIRRLPAVLYVDSKDQEGRKVENLLRDTYGLPLVSFYIDKIDKPRIVAKYLHQLTAHEGLPYLFICGTFIGSQEHVMNYHKNKQIPQLVEYVCGEEKDKKNQKQSSHKDKKKKPSSKHKSRRQSKPA